MARRKNNKSSTRPQAGRDLSNFPSIAKLRLHRLPYPFPVSRVDLRLFEDRRLFSPSKPFSPAKSLVRRADTKLVVPFTDNTKVHRLPDKVQFSVPKNVAICVRRKRRKEVIHALGRAGSGNRRPKRNEFSDVRC